MPADNGAPAQNSTGARRPKDEDLAPILELIWDGNSLRKACEALGLHVPSTSDWLHADTGRSEQYAHARDGRAEFLAEDGQDMTRAAALGLEHDGHKVDPAGVRTYLDAIKWNTARMSPKTAPVQRHAHSFEHLTDAELDERLAALEAARDISDAEPSGEG